MTFIVNLFSLFAVLLTISSVSTAEDLDDADSLPYPKYAQIPETIPGYQTQRAVFPGAPPPYAFRRNQVLVGEDLTRKFGITPESSLLDVLRIVASNLMMVVDIAAKEMTKGSHNILRHMNEHDNGGINVRAETTMGAAAGMLANNILTEFLQSRWNGLISHVVQEALDRFTSGSEEFFARATSGF